MDDDTRKPTYETLETTIIQDPFGKRPFGIVRIKNGMFYVTRPIDSRLEIYNAELKLVGKYTVKGIITAMDVDSDGVIYICKGVEIYRSKNDGCLEYIERDKKEDFSTEYDHMRIHEKNKDVLVRNDKTLCIDIYSIKTERKWVFRGTLEKKNTVRFEINSRGDTVGLNVCISPFFAFWDQNYQHMFNLNCFDGPTIGDVLHSYNFFSLDSYDRIIHGTKGFITIVEPDKQVQYQSIEKDGFTDIKNSGDDIYMISIYNNAIKIIKNVFHPSWLFLFLF